MKGAIRFVNEWRPVVVIVLVQTAFAGMNIFYKLAVGDGTNLTVLVAYRSFFVTAFTVPLALFVERGSLAQNLFVQSLALTSATYAVANPNLMPAITFVVAISFGMEKLNLGTPERMAEVTGSAVRISGAMLFTFYKGAKMSTRLPAHYTSASLMCIMGSIQSVVLELCMESNWADWKLGFNIRLLTAAYTGIMTAGLVVILITWCVHQRGPLFVSIFSPLTLVIVSSIEALFLNEDLHLGSILGGVLIICGLYMVLWGKSKENKKIIKLSKATQDSEPTGIVVEGSDINSSNAAGNAVDGDKFKRGA